ncbi:MAG: hypothetical protein AAF570_05075, partial [Bacteroidota bacterium]
MSALKGGSWHFSSFFFNLFPKPVEVPMKQAITLFFAFFVSCFAYSQQHETYVHPLSSSLKAEGTIGPMLLNKAAGGQDTLRQYVDRATGFTIIGSAAGGYVFGTNSDGQGGNIATQTGVHFDAYGNIDVQEVCV